MSVSPFDVNPRDLEPLLLDGVVLAKNLGVHPGTIRNWASAGDLIRRGRDASGRTLYDYDEAKALATRRTQDAGAREASITVTADCLATRLPAVRRCEIANNSARVECGAPIAVNAPFPICELHLRQAFLFMAERLQQFRDQDRSEYGNRRYYDDPGRFVYYARRRGLYKIGNTEDVHRRMLQLDAELLVAEPGGVSLEQARLKQFDHLRIAPGYEWLHPAPELESHIAMVQRHELAAGRTGET